MTKHPSEKSVCNAYTKTAFLRENETPIWEIRLHCVHQNSCSPRERNTHLRPPSANGTPKQKSTENETSIWGLHKERHVHLRSLPIGYNETPRASSAHTLASVIGTLQLRAWPTPRSISVQAVRSSTKKGYLHGLKFLVHSLPETKTTIMFVSMQRLSVDLLLWVGPVDVSGVVHLDAASRGQNGAGGEGLGGVGGVLHQTTTVIRSYLGHGRSATAASTSL